MPEIIRDENTSTTWKIDSLGVGRVATPQLALRLAENSLDSNILYIGHAIIGSLESDAVWRIKKLDTTTGIVMEYADGNDRFDNVWDDRESLSYS